MDPLGIAPTFLKLDLWLPGPGFIPILSTKDRERKIVRKKLSFMKTKRFNTFLEYGCNSMSTKDRIIDGKKHKKVDI